MTDQPKGELTFTMPLADDTDPHFLRSSEAIFDFLRLYASDPELVGYLPVMVAHRLCLYLVEMRWLHLNSQMRETLFDPLAPTLTLGPIVFD